MPDPLLPGPMWLVGCGNMGGAMLDGWIAAGVDPASVSVIRPSGRPVGHKIRVTIDFPEDEVPAVVVLAMKPRQLDLVAPALAPILAPETLLISVLAGTDLSALHTRFPGPRTIVKAMPNLPVRLGKGVVPLHSDSGDIAARALVTGLMAGLGRAEWFEEEGLFEAAGVLTGAGPAYLFRLIHAAAVAGEAIGVPADQAARLATAMVEGAAALAAASSDPPGELARKVASPGGVTQAGLDVLDEDDALLDLVGRTFEAAHRRRIQMASEGGQGGGLAAPAAR